jgi:hypothetical protein
MDAESISYCKIFPPIGVGRVGDSIADDGFFFAAETSDGGPTDLDGVSSKDFRYRDNDGRVKRQAARFRIYAFDSRDTPLGEVTSIIADIIWEAELANKKAAWFGFAGAHGALSSFAGEQIPMDVSGQPLRPRNASIGKMLLENNAGPYGKRHRGDRERTETLEIHGRVRTISGPNQRHDPQNAKPLDFAGKFKKTADIYLGELRTDSEGRLIVLGGRGKSDAVNEAGQSIRTARWITHYANNDDWYDDTSDGPIRAKVYLKGEKKAIEVKGGAWVVITPPDFAPDIQNLVTLYDVMEEVALNSSSLNNESSIKPRSAADTEWERDISPLIDRIASYRWVSGLAQRGHGFGKPGEFGRADDDSVQRLNADTAEGKS